MEDPYEDPDFDAFVKDVQEGLIPKLEASGIVASLLPTGKADIKFAVELGLSIMMDKPIIALIQPGATVPDHMVRVADRIVEVDPDNPAETSRRMNRAMDEIIESLELKGKE